MTTDITSRTAELQRPYDPALIAQFDRPVPRYTSYPTSPHFHDGVDAETYVGWLRSLDPAAPVSLYLHVPYCQALCWYCGCYTHIVSQHQPIADYARLLEQEIALVTAKLSFKPKVSHIHFGGGTPNMLSPRELRHLFKILHRHFEIDRQAEIAVEIDPRQIDQDDIDALADCGVNRASLGVQDFNEQVQQSVNRIQPYKMTAEVVAMLRRAGIDDISFDLIYGLPHQTVDSVLETAELALTLNPNRLAVFGYAHVPWMKKHQQMIPGSLLPNALERFQQQFAIAAYLSGAEYVRIGLDHYARPGDKMAQALKNQELRRNFQGYTTDVATTLIGFGASSIGNFAQGYAQNSSHMPDYRQMVSSGRLPVVRGVVFNQQDKLRRDIIERLMCDFSVALEDICAAHDIPADGFAAELAEIDRLAASGIVRRNGGDIEITPIGAPFVRVVCAIFDQYLETGAGRHSKAV